MAISARTRKWALLTADVQAAFLKAQLHDEDRVLYCWQSKTGHALPEVNLAWEKISELLVQIRFRKQRMCLGQFTLHSPAGTLSGVICLNFDDMLGTDDELFE